MRSNFGVPDDQIRRLLEMANRYYGPGLRAANEAARRNFETWQKIGPQIRRTVEQAQKAADAPRLAVIRSFTFARGGWHDVPLGGMVAGTFREWADELADKPDDEVKAELDEVIPAYFATDECAPLRDMVDGWDLYPDWRKRVFDEAFWAHKNGRYILSVSALASQIEGMLRQETSAYGRNDPWIRKVNEVLDFDYNPKEPTLRPDTEDLERAVEQLRTQDLPERFQTAERISLEHALFRVNELYNHGEFSDQEFVNSTNRHAILHGVAEDFGELESVKLFCAIELVHEIIIAYRLATKSASDGAVQN